MERLAGSIAWACLSVGLAPVAASAALSPKPNTVALAGAGAEYPHFNISKQ